MKKFLQKLMACFMIVMLVACARKKPDPNTFVFTPKILEKRQMETRRYDNIREADLLSASAQVLQDLGYILEGSETKLGVLIAHKQRDATDAGEIAANVATWTAVFIAVDLPLYIILTPIYALGNARYKPSVHANDTTSATSEDQTIRVVLVVQPVRNEAGKTLDKNHFVRVGFQRIVRRGSFSAETLQDPAIYQEFFKRLSKSVSLEAQKI